MPTITTAASASRGGAHRAIDQVVGRRSEDAEHRATEAGRTAIRVLEDDLARAAGGEVDAREDLVGAEPEEGLAARERAARTPEDPSSVHPERRFAEQHEPEAMRPALLRSEATARATREAPRIDGVREATEPAEVGVGSDLAVDRVARVVVSGEVLDRASRLTVGRRQAALEPGRWRWMRQPGSWTTSTSDPRRSRSAASGVRR